TFPSDLEPAQIARKLVATMEARTEKTENGMHAPSTYVVRVHPADFERLSPHAAYLRREWSALLLDLAQRVGIAFDGGDPSARLEQDDAVVAGAMEIDAERGRDLKPSSDDPAAPRSYVLRMVKGVPPNTMYDITMPTSVGRNADQDISLPDPSVSRSHAVLEPTHGGVTVRDLGSTNGTYINGERIRSARAHSGDAVTFGKTHMRLEEADS
ncbi:MAG: FHA domain-containing protein, partial [Candidatus Eremiobacteraeota bacterium]|nr:FHA domain-containing protein [Candidatus Eremiobacteraeota bacterium]